MQLSKHEAKLHFAETFVDLVDESRSIDSVSVNMIAERLGKHPKTFYYHFTSKGQFITWLFRYDLAVDLIESFPSEILIWEDGKSKETYPEFPYYIRNIREGGGINNASFFEVFASSLEKRRFYYRRLLAKSGQGTLQDYLYDLYQPMLKLDILYLIDDCFAHGIKSVSMKRHLEKGAALDFLVEYFTGAFLTRLSRRLNYESARRRIEDIVPFENITHDSLYLLIRDNLSSYSDQNGF